jgi:hypothetical protein
MTTLILTFIIVLTIITLMSLGVIFGRQPIKGSCGGIKALGANAECELCGGDISKCTN